MGRIWLLTVVAVAVVIGIVACGGDDDAGQPPGPEPQAEEPARDPEPGPEPEPESADEFRGQEAVIYEYARTFCRAFPQREVARDLGLAPDADPVSIAEAYAGGKLQFQEAASEGCLEGLR